MKPTHSNPRTSVKASSRPLFFSFEDLKLSLHKRATLGFVKLGTQFENELQFLFYQVNGATQIGSDTPARHNITSWCHLKLSVFRKLITLKKSGFLKIWDNFGSGNYNCHLPILNPLIHKVAYSILFNETFRKWSLSG